MTDLSATQQKFILHWGEMGARWGVSRTVAQIHALLYLAEAPLTAEAIGAALGVARSNVSTSLRELQNWRLARVVHQRGDRRDHFETVHDVWEMLRIILEERRQREIEPTLALLRECVAEAEKERGRTGPTRDRLRELLDSFELVTSWYAQMRDVPSALAIRVMKMGSRVLRLLNLAKA